MSKVRWIKIVTDIFDDEKIRFIETLPEGDTIALMWFRLMCLAGKSNAGGFLMMTDKLPYTEEMLASIFGRDVKLIRLCLTTFERLSMVEIIDNKLYLTNWEKHQSAERLEEIRAQARLRTQEYRKRLSSGGVTSASQERDSTVTVTVQNKSIDIEKEGDIEKDKEKERENVKADKPPHTRFIPPLIDEVSDYCKERGNGVDAQRFIDYYSANGWKVGKNSMKDWRAAVRTWERNNQHRVPAPTSGNLFADMLKGGI